MPVIWKFRDVLRERGITKAAHVSKIVRDRTGYVLSTQAVCDLFNEQPKMLRVETSQALCNAFYCCLSEFFEVKPEVAVRPDRRTPSPPNPLSKKAEATGEGGTRDKTGEESRKNTSVDFAAFFPDAREYLSDS